MENKLRKIYKLANDYMAGEDVSKKEIIEMAAQVNVQNNEQMPDFLKPTFNECLSYMNMWGEDGLTFKGYVQLGEILIEDLSGFLGQYFND